MVTLKFCSQSLGSGLGSGCGQGGIRMLTVVGLHGSKQGWWFHSLGVQVVCVGIHGL